MGADDGATVGSRPLHGVPWESSLGDVPAAASASSCPVCSKRSSSPLSAHDAAMAIVNKHRDSIPANRQKDIASQKVRMLPKAAFNRAYVDMMMAGEKGILAYNLKFIKEARERNAAMHWWEGKPFKSNEELDAEAANYRKQYADLERICEAEANHVHGFVDSDAESPTYRTVFLREGGSDHVAVHEVMHVYEQDKFVERVQSSFHEAATEYMTDGMGVPAPADQLFGARYVEGPQMIADRINLFGGDKGLSDAYFGNDFSTMEKAYAANRSPTDPPTLNGYFEQFDKHFDGVKKSSPKKPIP